MKESEHLPSGKAILRSFDAADRLIREMHSYGGIQIACVMEFYEGNKVGETYIVNKRMVRRARYEKERAAYPDMPVADVNFKDVGADLVHLAGKEARQRAAAKKRHPSNPLSEQQEQEARRQILFFRAAGGHDLAILQKFLGDGEDPNSISVVGGFTPLYNACFGGTLAPEQSLATVKLLLQCGADPNLRFRLNSPMDGRLQTGLTALMFAGTAAVAEALLNAGADAKVADDEGITPLMRAAARGDVELTQLLAAAGADVAARDNNRQAAADFARAKLNFYLENLAALKQDVAKQRIEELRATLQMLESKQ